ELAWACPVAREALGVLPRNDAVELAGDDEDRARDAARDALEREGGGVALGLGLRGAMAAHAKRLAREIRQPVPRLGKIVWTRERDAGFHARLERRGARRVVAAEAHAPQPDAGRVDVAARLD